MTNKEITERIKAAGHEVPANLNRTKLEALAAEKGVSLEEKTESAIDTGYDPGRLMTPVMAVCGIAGEDARISLPDAGGEDSHPAKAD